MVCIYCPEPDRDSESHIVPEFLGRGPVLRRGVCRKCNAQFNRGVEQVVEPAFRSLRSLLGLKKKRGQDHPKMPVKASLGDAELRLSVLKQADLDNRMLVFKNLQEFNGAHGTTAFVAADQDQLDRTKIEFEKRHSGATCQEIAPEFIEKNLKFEFEIDYGVFADELCRRIAAKVSLEWWCRVRSPDTCLASSFADVARYALTGEGPGRRSVEIVTSREIYSGLSNVPFGSHVLIELQDLVTRKLTIVFGLFGWIFYKTVLSDGYAVASTRRMTLIDPRTGRMYSPEIVGSHAGLLDVLARADYGVQPKQVIFDGIQDIMLDRINEAYRHTEEQ